MNKCMPVSAGVKVGFQKENKGDEESGRGRRSYVIPRRSPNLVATSAVARANGRIAKMPTYALSQALIIGCFTTSNMPKKKNHSHTPCSSGLI